jgi:hypothetical protein
MRLESEEKVVNLSHPSSSLEPALKSLTLKPSPSQ